MSKRTQMSYGLGLAVGKWVHAFGIPSIFRSDGVWACVQASSLFKDLCWYNPNTCSRTINLKAVGMVALVAGSRTQLSLRAQSKDIEGGKLSA